MVASSIYLITTSSKPFHLPNQRVPVQHANMLLLHQSHFYSVSPSLLGGKSSLALLSVFFLLGEYDVLICYMEIQGSLLLSVDTQRISLICDSFWSSFKSSLKSQLASWLCHRRYSLMALWSNTCKGTISASINFPLFATVHPLVSKELLRFSWCWWTYLLDFSSAILMTPMLFLGLKGER